MVFVVIHGNDHIVVVPPPVFLPGETIPDQAAVALEGKVGMDVVIIFGIQGDTLHHPANRTGLWELGVLYSKG